jgi:hypothetical protein
VKLWPNSKKDEDVCQPPTDDLRQSNSIEVNGLYWKLVDEFYVRAAEALAKDSPVSGLYS